MSGRKNNANTSVDAVTVTVTEVDTRGTDVEARVVARIQAENVDEQERYEDILRSIEVYSIPHDLMISILWKNKGLTLSLVCEDELAFRYGGLVIANSHFGYSAGPGKLVEIYIEAAW